MDRIKAIVNSDFYDKIQDLYNDVVKTLFNDGKDFIIFDDKDIEPLYVIYDVELTDKCLLVGLTNDGRLLTIFDYEDNEFKDIEFKDIFKDAKLSIINNNWHETFNLSDLTDFVKSDWIRIVEYINKYVQIKQKDEIKLTDTDCEILDYVKDNVEINFETYNFVLHQIKENIILFINKLCGIINKNEIIFNNPIKCLPFCDSDFVKVIGVNDEQMIICHNDDEDENYTIEICHLSSDGLKLIYRELKNWYRDLKSK